MKERLNPNTVIRSARINRAILKTEDYIYSQLDYDWFAGLTFQMGPNCNLECPHCYCECGPKVKGRPRIDVVKRTLEQAVDCKFQHITLTDGEAVREQNREVLAEFCKYSSQIPLRVLTNAAFASSLRSASKWFEFMKASGFDFSKDGNKIQVSAGRIYPIPKINHYWLNLALKNTYPDATFPGSLVYTVLMLGKNKQDLQRARYTISCIDNVHGEKDIENRVERLSKLKLPTGSLGGCGYFPLGSDYPIVVVFDSIFAEGRAKNLPRFRRQKKKRYYPSQVNFNPDALESIYVFNNGDVSFGQTIRCAQRQVPYGNVLKEPLKQIKNRIFQDSTYAAFKLGGVRFLYYLARQVSPDFTAYGFTKCDICRDVRNDESLLNRIRDRFDVTAVVEEYRKYIEVSSSSRLSK